MSAKADAETGSLDSVKLVLALVILLGAIGAFHYFAEASQLLRVLGVLAAAGVSAFVALQTTRGKTFWGFLQDSRTEVRKVVWPTRQETMQTTMIVLVMVILMGILLWLLDMFLVWAVRLLTGQG